MTRRIRQALAATEHFFFAEAPMPTAALIRVVYAVLLLCNCLFWWPDLLRWFGPEGVLPLDASRTIVSSEMLTPFMWLPDTAWPVLVGYGLLLLHGALLALGIYPRVQAAGVFFWLLSFQHRNLIVFDGEDQVFRLFAFYLIFLPSAGQLSVLNWWRKRPPQTVRGPIWPLRLFQIQMTLIYASTAQDKLRGDDWVNGTALYYVSRLDDLFGHFPLPDAIFEWRALLMATTWAVLAIEVFIPWALWVPKLHRVALIAAVFLHLGIEYSMNLFLFQWIMLCGLLSFVNEEDLAKLRALRLTSGQNVDRKRRLQAPA